MCTGAPVGEISFARFGRRVDVGEDRNPPVKPGERVRVIQEIAESLVARDWAVAQLTLDQFGLETYDPRGDYDFDAHSYFIAQVKEATNTTLVNLHEYLVGEEAAPPGPDGPWNSPFPVTVFLSHVHEHRHFVGAVKTHLARRGIDGFVAHDDIQPSEQWREVIKAALGTCHAFVAFLHGRFHESQWCDQEVGWALGRGIPIVAVRPPNVERRDGFLEEHQDLLVSDAPNEERSVADEILEVVVRDPRTKFVGIRAVAEAFVNSGSYDMTRRLYEVLRSEDAIETDQLRRLEYAVQTNRQVYEAVFGQPARPIPKLVEELVRRHEPAATSSGFDDEEPF